MFKKYFKIIKEERVTGVLPYHIQERYTIFLESLKSKMEE